MRLDEPIFIAGLDHSGKTPVRRALERHPAFALARRIDLWTDLRGRLARGGDRGRADVIGRLTTGRGSRSSLDRARLERAIHAAGFAGLAREIGRQLCERAGAERWGLQEAMLEWHAPAVLELFPGARIIHVVRDPRDRYAAMVAGGAVGRAGIAGETAAWAASVGMGTAMAAVAPRHYVVLRFEDLAADPARALLELGRLLGEELDPGVLDGIPALPADRPQKGLALADRRFIERYAGAEMRALGYPIASLPAEPRMLGGLVESLKWNSGRAAWWLRSRPARTL